MRWDIACRAGKYWVLTFLSDLPEVPSSGPSEEPQEWDLPTVVRLTSAATRLGS